MAVMGNDEGLRKKAYFKIKDMILTGELAPGEAVAERDLAERLNMSRAPIREALLELERSRFIRQASPRIRVVENFTIQDMLEVYEVREMLEGTAARLLAPHITQEQLGLLRRLAHRLDVPKGSDEDEAEFHDFIMRECGNSRLSQISESVHDQLIRVHIYDVIARRGAPASTEPIKRAVTHMRIVEALENHDPETAERCAREHVKDTINNLLIGMLGAGAGAVMNAT